MAASTSSSEFYWSGLDKDGKRVKKRKIVARSKEAVVANLSRDGAIATEVVAAGGMAGFNLSMDIGGGAVKFKWAAKAEFARRLYQMIRAGISMPKALGEIGKDASPKVSDMCADLAEKVSSGVMLSEAMSAYPKAFDDVFVAYVASGEQSGTLMQAMENLSLLLAKRASMAAKIKGVMAYPKMVGGAIGIMVVGILMFLVPMYAKIYKGFGAPLPSPTLFVIGISKNFVPVGLTTQFGFPLPYPRPFAVLSVVFYLFIIWKVFRRQTRDNVDVNIFLNRIAFKVPLMGKLNHKNALFRWASTLGGALEAGVQTTQAIELAAAASGSKWMEALVPEFVEAVRSGRPLSWSTANHPKLFPSNIVTMLATGEETGEVDSMLMTVSKTLDEDIDSLVAGLSAKIEVALLLVLGVVVGGLLLVLYLPILNLAATASKGFVS